MVHVTRVLFALLKSWAFLFCASGLTGSLEVLQQRLCTKDLLNPLGRNDEPTHAIYNGSNVEFFRCVRVMFGVFS